MNSTFSIHRVVTLGLLTAVTVVVARVFLIPIPLTQGNVNLCDAGIFIAAFLYGKREGTLVGAVTGFILDLISGYAQYMFFSLIIHGIEGFIVGWLGYHKSRSTQLLALLAGILVMVVGYFLADTILYSITVAITGLLSNSLQGLIGAIVTYPIILKLKPALKL